MHLWSNYENYIHEKQGEWCDSNGTIEEVKAKLKMKEEGAIKRERALTYAIQQQVVNDFSVKNLSTFLCLVFKWYIST